MRFLRPSPPSLAVVVAAGSGTRLGGEQPKCLRDVAGTPLVVHALRALAAGGVSAAVVVVAPETRADFDRVLADSPLPVSTVPGGAERQDSVLAGLDALAERGHPADSVVLVHDGARPFVPAEVVRGVISTVREGAPAVIPVVRVVDTVRRVDDGESTVVDRSALRAVQTPQAFVLGTLRRAHREADAAGHVVTDDAAVCELAGLPVTLVAGDRASFKITEPLDLVVAEALMKKRA